MQDIWMHCIVLVVSLATAAVGIARLIMEQDFKQVQTMSILVRPLCSFAFVSEFTWQR